MFFSRSGTEEEYGSLEHLLEDMASFYEDCVAAKEALLVRKGSGDKGERGRSSEGD